jgi:hypothetical protein
MPSLDPAVFAFAGVLVIAGALWVGPWSGNSMSNTTFGSTDSCRNFCFRKMGLF